MGQKIYFGSVEVQNLKTRQKQIIEKQLFKEFDRPNDLDFRKKILIDMKPIEREKWQITKLCFETAKYLGITAY